MTHSLYHYRATVVAVYDGDTCTVDVDLGLYTCIKSLKLRLYRINAPEARGEEKEAGILSRDYLRALILDKKNVVETIKDDTEKYGRYLAEIWLEQDGQWVNINEVMVERGFAVYHDYRS